MRIVKSDATLPADPVPGTDGHVARAAGEEKPPLTNGWRVPPIWTGETVALIASGPSLTRAQIEHCLDRGWRMIAINTSGRIAPEADLLYFCDRKWWHWHKDEDWLKAFLARRAIVKGSIDDREAMGGIGGVNFLELDGVANLLLTSPLGYKDVGYEHKPDRLAHGRNSGYAVMNFAGHLDVSRMILLGYDMDIPDKGASHWHGGHPTPSKRSNYGVFRRLFPHLVRPLAARGIEVINATPGTKLTCFPMRDLGGIR